MNLGNNPYYPLKKQTYEELWRIRQREIRKKFFDSRHFRVIDGVYKSPNYYRHYNTMNQQQRYIIKKYGTLDKNRIKVEHDVILTFP